MGERAVRGEWGVTGEAGTEEVEHGRRGRDVWRQNRTRGGGIDGGDRGPGEAGEAGAAARGGGGAARGVEGDVGGEEGDVAEDFDAFGAGGCGVAGDGVANGEADGGVADDGALDGAHEREEWAGEGKLVGDLARHGGVHVEDVGDVEGLGEAAGDEGGFFDGVDEIVAVFAQEALGGGQEAGIEAEFLEGEAGADAGAEGRGLDAEDADGRGVVGGGAFGEGEEVDAVAEGGERAEEDVDGDGGAAFLEEGVWGDDEDVHGGAGLRGRP